MKHTAAFFLTSLLIAFLASWMGSGCTKPTPFGADLLDDQIADYHFIDTISLRCTLVREDSLLTSDRSSTADYMLCGQLNDPVFGKSQSDIYAQLALSDLDPDFKDAVVDSIVMYLRYDAAGFYGDTTLPQTIRVHRVASGNYLHWDKSYYSHNSLPTGELIGEATNILPKPSTAAKLFDTSATAVKAPYVRVPLDKAFGQALLNIDSLDLTQDSLFWKALRGIRISAEPAATPGAMMAFDLNSNAFSLIRLYYKQDTVAHTFDFDFLGANKFTNFIHDYSGVPLGAAIDQQLTDRLYLQGMGGLRLKVEFPYIHLLDKVAVNKAELALTALVDPGANASLASANQLVFTESVGDTLVTLTSDVVYALGPTLNAGFSSFGGFPETEKDNGSSVKRYRMTLTQRFQKMVDNTSGNIKDQTVYINVYPQSRSAMRAILYGPKSTNFPAKLSLKYTNVQ